MRSAPRCKLSLLLSLLMGALAAARDSTDLDAVWSSIEEQRQCAADGVIPTRIALEYVVEWHFPIDSGDLAAMKAKVKSLPDHPFHADIEMHESYLREGPRQNKTRVWASESGLLRSSVDFQLGSFPYLDSAFGPKSSWMLTADALTIADSAGVLAPATRNPAQVASSQRGEVIAILYGAFNFGPSASASRSQLRMQGDRWSLPIDSPSGGRIQLKGRWDAATKAALATEATLQAGPAVERSLIAIRSKDWVYQDSIGLWIPQIVEFDSGPNQYRAIIVSAVAVASLSEIQSLTRTPSLSEPDPIRGSLAIKSIYDYEAQPSSDALLTSAGIATIGGHAADGTLVRVRWLVFGAAASLLVLLIAYRTRQSRVSTHTPNQRGGHQ